MFHVSVTSNMQIKQNKTFRNIEFFLSFSLKIESTYDAVEFSKKCQGENWENVGILKRLQKRSAFSICCKYLLKPRPGSILTTSMIFDSLVKQKKSRFTAP